MEPNKSIIPKQQDYRDLFNEWRERLDFDEVIDTFDAQDSSHVPLEAIIVLIANYHKYVTGQQ